LKQSHGIAPRAEFADLSLEELMGAVEKGRVSMVARLRATYQMWDELPPAQREEKRIADGYYGWCNNEQVLESNNDTRLQPTVQEVASSYISASGRIVNHGENYRHQSKPRGKI
jgi:hypothetical protein